MVRPSATFFLVLLFEVEEWRYLHWIIYVKNTYSTINNQNYYQWQIPKNFEEEDGEELLTYNFTLMMHSRLLIVNNLMKLLQQHCNRSAKQFIMEILTSNIEIFFYDKKNKIGRGIISEIFTNIQWCMHSEFLLSLMLISEINNKPIHLNCSTEQR